MGSHRSFVASVLTLSLGLLGAFHSPVGQDSVADLRSRLGRLQGELALEQQFLEELQSETEKSSDRMRAQRRDLGEQLLDARLEREKVDAERRRLEQEWPGAVRDYKRGYAAMRAAQSAASSAAKVLGIHFREVPGRIDEKHEVLELTDELGLWLDRLPSGSEAPEVEGLGAIELSTDAWQRILSLELLALEDGDFLSVSRTRIRTAAGVEEDVSLLRVGNLRFGYTIGDRVGVALQSPVDADGYRWSEELTPEIHTAFGTAIGSIEAGRVASRWLNLPLDPTGQIRPDSLVQVESLEDRIRDGGPLMIPLGLVAVAAILLSLERFWTLFLRNARGARLARRVIGAAQAGQLEEALEHCNRSGGAVARTLGACLRRTHQGVQGMEDGIQEQLLNEVPSLERFIRSIAILAGVAPLLGLLGTVTGIIQTFGVIKALGTTDPALMAGGISVALITTAAGLSVAIPVLLAQGILRGRGTRILSDAERYAASLLVVLAHDQPSGAAGRFGASSDGEHNVA